MPNAVHESQPGLPAASGAAQAGAGLTLTALSLADPAKVLSKAGRRPVTEAMLRQDVEAGAHVNPDGTINLIYYAAWLAREVARGD
jgi:hypothetical protein